MIPEYSITMFTMIDRSQEPTGSVLWIEYDELVSIELVPVLLSAEAEWLENAPETYGNDAGEVWAQDIVPRLTQWSLRDVDIEDLRLYAPNFLMALTGLPAPEMLPAPELSELLSAAVSA